jgi:pyruvate formate lyase activating enzyme
MAEIERDLIYFDQSGGGVTLSGGEPLLQHRFLALLLDRCRDRGIHTAVDTSGFAPEAVMADIAQRADLILFDLKLAQNDDHLRFTGVPAEPVHRNLALLAGMPCRVKLRLPVIPGITDTRENLEGLVDLVSSLTIFREFTLLPFHRTGEDKYRRLGKENPMSGVRPPKEKHMEALGTWFESRGFSVSIGD